MKMIENPGFNVDESFRKLHQTFMSSGTGEISTGSTNDWRWYHFESSDHRYNRSTFVNTRLNVIAVFTLFGANVLTLADENGLPNLITALKELGCYVE